MSQRTDKFEEKLPARITGLVFWGLIFVGLLIAVIALHSAEARLKDQYTIRARALAYEIENIVDQYPYKPVIKTAASRIRVKVNALKSMLDFSAVSITEGKTKLVIGVPEKDDDVFNYIIHYYPKNSTLLQTINLKIYCANSTTTIARIRKQVLLSIGLGLILFGFLLQRILQRMLSAPFQKMVATARQFSKGNEKARFDDTRQDEFGYLGGFINDAIDMILGHKNKLVKALDRASRSEKALSIQKERAEITLYSITDSVITADKQERILYVNPAAEVLLGVVEKNIINQPFNQVFNIVDENTSVVLEDPLHKCFVTKQTVHLPEHSSLMIDGVSLVSIEASIAPMKSSSGDLIGAVIVIQDVSHTRRLTRQLSYHASHDLLTGLYNRRRFEEHLKEVLHNVVENKEFHSLFYLDLDNFKIVNDTCGHVAGDELLKQLPSLFNNVLRSGDIVARLGGDEFGIILENCRLEQASTIAEKIRQIIKDYRFVWGDKIFEIGVSIGVVGIDAKHIDMAKILSSADIACYAAKDSGRNRVHVYEPSDEVVSERFGQIGWTERILHAMENNRFRLFQQPIIGISGKFVEHHEVLIRMLDDNDKIILPGAFLPAAERYGLMHDIDRWVISKTFKYMSRDVSFDLIAGTDRILTINLSGDSINDDSLLDFILHEKTINNISLVNVCFEVTETVAISNLTKAAHFIYELKKLGCQFALDDFGSGLSSFTYLKTLPVDYLKIDGSFVRDVSRDKIDRAMVESIQQIGKAMNLKTIAEHVEDESTLSVLKEIGIDYVQGYYLGRPDMFNTDD